MRGLSPNDQSEAPAQPRLSGRARSAAGKSLIGWISAAAGTSGTGSVPSGRSARRVFHARAGRGATRELDVAVDCARPSSRCWRQVRSLASRWYQRSPTFKRRLRRLHAPHLPHASRIPRTARTFRVFRTSAALAPPALSHLSHLSTSDPHVETTGATSSLEDVVSNSIPAIVSIETREGRGSGFFAAPRTVITNRHVVGSNVSVTVRLASGATLPGRVETVSQDFDLALVHVDGASHRHNRCCRSARSTACARARKSSPSAWRSASFRIP